MSWLAANGARELGASRLIVGGESAGAHLAALALLVLRDRGQRSAVTAANLAYGVYDVSMTPSARSWGDQRIVVNTSDLAASAAQSAPEERHRDPDVSPLYADLSGLPPAGRRRATQVALYPGAPHEFLNLREAIPAAAGARERMAGFVEAALAGDGPAT
jgi:acetyl esterase/lipase